jgi:hypothetical protein
MYKYISMPTYNLTFDILTFGILDWDKKRSTFSREDFLGDGSQLREQKREREREREREKKREKHPNGRYLPRGEPASVASSTRGDQLKLNFGGRRVQTDTETEAPGVKCDPPGMKLAPGGEM